jgi:hypothetical protein
MGVGESTADSILDVLDDHDTDGHGGPLLEKALDAADDGDDREAALYLRRYLND